MIRCSGSTSMVLGVLADLAIARSNRESKVLAPSGEFGRLG